ncbi:MAG: hypothetical protein AAGI37_00030 [Planctomycetota bacterium]
MSKKKTTKKKKKKITGTSRLIEKTAFFADTAGNDPDKNNELATLASTAMLDESIVSVKRIEIGRRGWEFTYRA